LASPLKSTSRLEAENTALRHQRIVQRKVRGRVELTNGGQLYYSSFVVWSSEFFQIRRLVVELQGDPASLCAGLANQANKRALMVMERQFLERLAIRFEAA
jgi:hypothetical protein